MNIQRSFSIQYFLHIKSEIFSNHSHLMLLMNIDHHAQLHSFEYGWSADGIDPRILLITFPKQNKQRFVLSLLSRFRRCTYTPINLRTVWAVRSLSQVKKKLSSTFYVADIFNQAIFYTFKNEARNMRLCVYFSFSLSLSLPRLLSQAMICSVMWRIKWGEAWFARDNWETTWAKTSENECYASIDRASFERL